MTVLDTALNLLLDAEQSIVDQAVAEFGLTSNVKEAGYILPDGRMLDFSGKREGGPPGMRSYDHRDIGRVMTKGGTEGMLEFMDKAHAVRFQSARDGDVFASTVHPLTNAQKVVLLRSSRFGSSFVFDVYERGTHTVVSSNEFSPVNKANIQQFLMML